ncbi:MAG: hypothetical protein EOO46_06980 [Flavobacterium sp.]|nr:MAG: hypothetical protein EOO46_06980 [Flavobacterium sp.]
MKITPEGGNYIRGIENAMGISLLDDRHNTIANAEGNLQTFEGEVVRTFKLSKFGYAKITVPPSDKKLKIVFSHNDKVFEKELPHPTDIGLGMIVNNFSDENKTFLNLSTNANTLKSLETKKLFLVISKDEKSMIQEFKFDNQTKKNFIIEKKSLFNGINTLRIIDGELNQLCERLIYSDSIKENPSKIISISKRASENDQINLVGFNSLSESSISIAALPVKSKANDYGKTNINVGLNINPYLLNPLENPSYYFKKFDRPKKIELDLILAQQSNKYNWNTMKTTIPKSNYSFDIGLSIKGKIQENIKNKTLHKAKLLSHIAFINLESDINENGEYSIDKFVVADSSYLDLSLLKLPDFKRVDTKLTPQILNRNRPFNKPFKIALVPSNLNFEYDKAQDEYPKLSEGTISLEEVVVKNKNNRPKLTFENEFGNFNLRGYKIDASYTMPLLHFISSQGFGVTRNQGEISITNKISSSFSGEVSSNGTPPPQEIKFDQKEHVEAPRVEKATGVQQSTVEVTINDRTLFSLNELDYMQMSEIDEIFLNRDAIVIGIRNKQGIIKIYTKKNISKIKEPESFKFFIEKGFSKSTKYKPEKYLNPSEIGFENYGVIGWNPDIISDNDGRFEFDIQNFNKEKVVIDIEGINTNGQIIQQELVLNLN